MNTVFILISLKTEIARSVNGTKLQGLHAEDANGEAVLGADKFGDLITADHKVLSDNCESRNNHRYAVVVQDLATQWIQAYPVQNQNFTRNPEKLAKVSEAREEAKSHLHYHPHTHDILHTTHPTHPHTLHTQNIQYTQDTLHKTQCTTHNKQHTTQRQHKQPTTPYNTQTHIQHTINFTALHQRTQARDCHSCCAQCNHVTLGVRPPIQLSAVGDRSLMWPYHITGTPGCSTPLCSVPQQCTHGM